MKYRSLLVTVEILVTISLFLYHLMTLTSGPVTTSGVEVGVRGVGDIIHISHISLSMCTDVHTHISICAYCSFRENVLPVYYTYF